MTEFRIGSRRIAPDAATYFIADIAANHDGDLTRAKRLIKLAKDAGADAAKFQHFKAPRIVSRVGFESLGGQFSHQANWKRPVYDIYQDASVPRGWTAELKAACDELGIDFFSTPYDFEAVELLAPLVPAFKVGSGDITWHEFLQTIAATGKPIILSTGASDIGEVQRAVEIVLTANNGLALLQCNTNYTAAPSNFDHIHLNVLKTYQTMFPDIITGLSDHTPGHATVLGAVALGGRIIEKHFTDDVTREGPDHRFSMTPDAWREMVDRTRELERALGSPRKCISGNERDTVVLQRRCLRAARDLPAGHVLTRADIDVLRPAPADSISAAETARILGKRITRAVSAGEAFRLNCL